MQRANSARCRRGARSGDTLSAASQMERHFKALTPEKQRLALGLLRALVKAQEKAI